METQNLLPGTDAWHAHRARHLNASDAPAMLGCSPFKTRAQLLQELHTGLKADVDPATQRRFAEGHRFEALARPLAEQIIGDDLAPVVGTEGELSASFDGLTLMGDTVFEHKTLNDDLRSCMRDQGNGYDLPKHYQVQMEQQLMVSGAERCLFMASKWDGDTLIEERHCWYASDPALRAEIIAGWRQFAIDLAAYVPTEAAAPVTAAPIEALPAVSVRMDGALAVVSNLDVFGAKLREFVGRIPAKPTSDQDFADADAAVKALKKAEEALDGAEANALGQVQSVETLTRTIGDLRSIARTARLATEKLVTARKTQIRTEEVQRGKTALAEFIAGLNTTIGKPYMPPVAADFAGAISGKKTMDSLRNAIDTELARAKIAANEIAGTIVINLRWLREHAKDHTALFPDTGTIVLKAPEDLQALAQNRINEHRESEQKKADELRERIRAEEAAKLQREQQEKEALERRQREEDEARQRREREAEEALARQTAQAAARQEGEPAEPRRQDDWAAPAQPPAADPFAAPGPVSQAANVVPMGTRAPKTPPTLTVGKIGERLGFALPAEFLKQLGFEPAGTARGAKLFHEADLERIVAALIQHLMRIGAECRQVA